MAVGWPRPEPGQTQPRPAHRPGACSAASTPAPASTSHRSC